MKKLNVISQRPWYAEGLNFACTGCGQCCTGAPGYIWVSEDEIQKIAAFLNLSLDDFAQCYLRRVKGRFSLLEKPKSYDCVFLEGNKCTIYAVRPTQCRTFPWWPQLLKSADKWHAAAKHCEGIHPDAPLVSFQTIEEQRLIQEDANLQS